MCLFSLLRMISIATFQVGKGQREHNFFFFFIVMSTRWHVITTWSTSKLKKGYGMSCSDRKLGCQCWQWLGGCRQILTGDKELEFYIAQNNEGNHLPHFFQLLSYLMFILAV